MFGSASTTETLTDDFTDNQSRSWPISGMHSVVVYAWYTPKSGQTDRNLQMKIEFSGDDSRWTQLTKRTDVSGTDAEFERFLYTETFKGATGGTEYPVRFALGDIADKFVRVSFQEDGSSNFGTIAAQIIYSGK